MPSFDTARAGLSACWQAAIGTEFDAPYMHALEAFVAAERAAGKVIYPAEELIFAALTRTPLSRVKAVILGQDPYHGPGQAMGLAFSVPHGIRCPPSLRNIFRELEADIGVPAPRHGCLVDWADRGVLLLNTALTVEAGRAGSHARVGWHRFTDRVLQAVSIHRAHVVFLLWGNHARSKAPLLDATRHLLHVSEHPSPLAAYRGFFGSRPFSTANAFLAAHGVEPMDWHLPMAQE